MLSSDQFRLGVLSILHFPGRKICCFALKLDRQSTVYSLDGGSISTWKNEGSNYFFLKREKQSINDLCYVVVKLRVKHL
jgi:hypothetical protein